METLKPGSNCCWLGTALCASAPGAAAMTVVTAGWGTACRELLRPLCKGPAVPRVGIATRLWLHRAALLWFQLKLFGWSCAMLWWWFKCWVPQVWVHRLAGNGLLSQNQLKQHLGAAGRCPWAVEGGLLTLPVGRCLGRAGVPPQWPPRPAAASLQEPWRTPRRCWEWIRELDGGFSSLVIGLQRQDAR